MKIFSASQIKEWDQYTILQTPVPSIELMEIAGVACFRWIKNNINSDKNIYIFCGTGNNGGDGLALARLLLHEHYNVSVYIPYTNKNGTNDFEENLKRLYDVTGRIRLLQNESGFPQLNKNDVVIDALFGTGLHSSIAGLHKSIIDHINNSQSLTISIDMPSGLLADFPSEGSIIKANYTLTFQCYKLALLMAENEKYFGNVIVLPINLHREYEAVTNSSYSLLTFFEILKIYKPRAAFAHKGTFGHAGIIAGSYGMMGAAVLCTKACVRSGAGKVTAIVCKKGYTIIQSFVPEAMCFISGKNFLKNIYGLQNFSAVGVGPGLGRSTHNSKLLKQLFSEFKNTIVIDADGLNTLALDKDLKKALPKNCILTPHPKEFDNLFGRSANDFERLGMAIKVSVATGIYIILKGHRTAIIPPDGKVYFNTTGNAGMAKGGSGDVLTGVLTGLLAQGYNPEEACLLGVYLHGKAGDIASSKFSKESMTPSDIIDFMGDVFKELNTKSLGGNK